MVDEDPNLPDESGFNFDSPIVKDGYAYWRSKLKDGALPARADIDPAEIPRLLPNIILLDVQREPDWDFRYRLIGTRVVEHLFRDYTGMWFSEIDHQRPPSTLWSNCRQVAESAAPMLANTEYIGPHQGFRRAEDVLLPLADDGRTVDTLLVFVAYLPRV